MAATKKKAAGKRSSTKGGKSSKRPLLRVEGLPASARRARPVSLIGTETVSKAFELVLELEVPGALAA